VKFRAAIVGCAVAAALLPTPPAAVERWYANGLFPGLQALVTSVSNRSAIAFLDVIIVGTALGIAGLAIAFGRRRGPRSSQSPATVTRIVAGIVVLAAALYLVFLAAWGLNYRRVPLVGRLRFDETRLSADRARALAVESTVRLNALYEAAHAAGQPGPYEFDPGLADAFHTASPQFGVRYRPVLPRPKRSLLDLYFRRAGVAGMTDPFFLEALIASDLLPVERSFVLAHEWSHASGIADEGEANFAGWLTCLRGTPAHRYSGWLFAYGELAGSLGDRDRPAIAARLASGPRADLAAIRDRLQRQVSPRLSAAGWRVYDRYLKANRVTAGTASYSQVVRLMLGVEIERRE
jgi:hypothetical protein